MSEHQSVPPENKPEHENDVSPELRKTVSEGITAFAKTASEIKVCILKEAAAACTVGLPETTRAAAAFSEQMARVNQMAIETDEDEV